MLTPFARELRRWVDLACASADRVHHRIGLGAYPEEVRLSMIHRHLEKIRRPKMKIIKAWCQQLLAAVEYLHGQGVVHGNIRCANVLVNTITN